MNPRAPAPHPGAVLLDRGRYIRRPTVVHFVRHSAGRVLLVADETLHVTSSPDPGRPAADTPPAVPWQPPDPNPSPSPAVSEAHGDQRAALKDTFASSTLAAFDVVGRGCSTEEIDVCRGHVLFKENYTPCGVF